MPGIATVFQNKLLFQTFVYWQKRGSDGYGKPVYVKPPIQVACRWEDKQQEIVLMDGRKVMSKGYLFVVTPLLVGSLVLLGTLAVWQALPTYPEIPTVLQGGREILLVRTVPDVRAIWSLSEVFEVFL